MSDHDILQPVAAEDIPKLRDLYKTDLPRAAYIYNYLNSVIKWKSQRPEKNYITLMAPHGNWKDGTFISVHEYSCYELFMFTLERDCKALCEALINSKKIVWNRGLIFYSMYEEYCPSVLKALEKTPFRYHDSSTCTVWWIPKEKALNFEISCPPEVYIGKLDPVHAVIINSQWPPRYEESEKYLAKMIEMNGGYGVFLKSSGVLVAWVIRNLLGLGALQTVTEHKRKGYGSLITKVLAKEIAKEGFDPLGTVSTHNEASEVMFSKLGFEARERVVYVENQEMRKYLYSQN